MILMVCNANDGMHMHMHIIGCSFCTQQTLLTIVHYFTLKAIGFHDITHSDLSSVSTGNAFWLTGEQDTIVYL